MPLSKSCAFPATILSAQELYPLVMIEMIYYEHAAVPRIVMFRPQSYPRSGRVIPYLEMQDRQSAMVME